MAAIDLNADLGEGIGDDEAMLAVVTSVNIACGGHAGDERSMREVARLAAVRGVTIGAHPSYPDREGFGRRAMDPEPAQLRADLEEQVAALIGAAGRPAVRYLKPHGALYNRIVVDNSQAAAVAQVAADAGLPLLGLRGSAIERAAGRAGVRFVAEAFADRGYLPDGSLAPRHHPAGVLHDPEAIAQRVVRLAIDGEVAAVDGSLVRVEAASVCVHGDTPGAVAIATAVRAALQAAGVNVRGFA